VIWKKGGSNSGSENVEITVVIPAYNEEEGIASVLEELEPRAVEQGWEILVVDDGSVDETGAAAERIALASKANIRVIKHGRNQGYGAALKAGIRQASGAFVATMDGDGQHSCHELKKLLAEREEAALVVGARKKRLHSPLWRMPGKWVLGWLARYLSGQKIPDLNSGLRVFRTDVVRRYLHLCPQGFSFSTTSTLVLLNRGHEVAYVPIDIRPRVGKSTVTLATGFETLLLMTRLTMLLAPLRIFVPVGLGSILFGALWTLPYLLARKGLTVLALLFILFGALVLLFGLLADQIAELRKERYEA
jgi:glycosyltransferase involved in cell wall biosynthesis